MTMITCHGALYHSSGQHSNESRGAGSVSPQDSFSGEENITILDSHDGTILDERDTKLWGWLCGAHTSIQSKISSFVTSLERNSWVRSVR